MKTYTEKELKSLHSIALNALYKRVFLDGNYFANNHLLQITDLEMVQAILKEQRKKQRQLKDSTIKQYSNKQILKHLDKFMSKYFTDEPFRIDFATGNVSSYNIVDNAYYFYCSTEDRETILKALNTAYSLVK